MAPTAQPHGAQEKQPRAVDLLGEPLRSVLVAGHAAVALVLDDVDPAALTEPAKLHALIEVFGVHAALRQYVALKYPEVGGPGTVSQDASQECTATALLVSPDATHAARGVTLARGLLSSALTEARASRRRQRRERRPAEEKAAERTETQTRKLREGRDRAVARLEHAETELAQLRDRLGEVEQARRDAVQRHHDTERQLDRLRERFTDVPTLAGLLAEQLSAITEHGAHPAESVPAHDPFAVVDRIELPGAAVAGALAALDARDVPNPTTGAEDETGAWPGVDAGELLPGPPAGVTGSDLGLGAGAAAEERVSDPDSDVGEQAGWTPMRRLLRTALRTIAAPPLAFTRERRLRVEVLGAGAEIGGSCVLVQAGETRILIDCGMRPGATTLEGCAPPGYAMALEGPVHGVVITHAHNDHAGWVPALVATRPGTAVYATPATCDLLGTMWRDSAKVMARNGVRGYALSDVDRAIEAFRETSFRSVVRIKDLTVELFPAGHIVGAASVVITAGNERVVVSGDISASGQETVGGFSPSSSAIGADLLLLESTYAGEEKTITPRGATVSAMMREIEGVAERGGVVLVPAFALGRAQEVALLMRRHLPQVPVLIDGLAREVTEIYERHGPEGRARSIYGDQVRAVPVGGTEKAAQSFAGGVVITTSGMLNQGPAVRWAKRVLPDPNSALMIVGYQDAESPGARLLRLADAGGGVFDLPTREGEETESVPVYADVSRHQLGAHANANELATIVSQMQARQVMLVHGERRGQEQFRVRMTRRAQSSIPAGSWSAT